MSGDDQALTPHTLSVSGKNKVTLTDPGDDALAVKLSSGTGGLSGSFIHPLTQKKTAFSGVVQQKLNLFCGMFLRPEQRRSGAAHATVARRIAVPIVRIADGRFAASWPAKLRSVFPRFALKNLAESIARARDHIIQSAVLSGIEALVLVDYPEAPKKSFGGRRRNYADDMDGFGPVITSFGDLREFPLEIPSWLCRRPEIEASRKVLNAQLRRWFYGRGWHISNRAAWLSGTFRDLAGPPGKESLPHRPRPAV